MSIFDPDDAVMRDRANMARLTGSCIFAWTNVETSLTFLFAYATGGRKDVAFAVMECVNSFEVRLDMTNAAIKMVVVDEKLLELWSKLYNRMSRLAKKRNELAHSRLVTWTDVTTMVGKVETIPYYKVQSEPKTRLKAEDLVLRHNKFFQLEQALNWMRSAVLAPEGTSPTENKVVPDLVRELRSASVPTHKGSARPPQPSGP